ncbi:MAG: tetratricopeptide repeat protein [Nitrospiraceae bacterium]
MAIDKTAVLQQAQTYAAKGNLDAAIAEWKKLAQESPHDGTIHNSIGDLQLKRNAKNDAITAFLQAAKAFRDDGAPLKAMAAYKKVLKIDPARMEVYRFLGDLNAERGLLTSAVADYQTLAKHYLKDKQTKQALEIYRLIVQQDPSNLDAHQRVAELCLQENLPEEAVRVYLQIGRERSAQGRANDARDAYAAVLKLDPTNREAEQFLNAEKMATAGGPSAVAAPGGAGQPTDMFSEARRRMASGQFEGAEAMLSQLLSREPGNPEICRLLAQLHLKQGLLSVAQNEYRFLAGSALRSQDYDLAESLINEYLAVESKAVPLLELLADLYEEKGDGATAAAQLGKAIAILLEHPDPHLPSLPSELFERMTLLDPQGAVRAQYARIFEGGEDPATVLGGASKATTGAPATPPPAPAAAPAPTMSAPLVVPLEPTPTATAPTASTSVPVAAAAPAAPSSSGPVTEFRFSFAQASSESSSSSVTPAAPATPPASPAEKPATVIPTAKPLSFAKADGESAPAAVPTQQPAAVTLTQPAAVPAAAAPAPTPIVPIIPAAPIEPEPVTRYALAVALRQMGLPEEAIEELKIAAKTPELLFDVCVTLSLCLKDLGRLDQAIAQLEEASRHPACVDEKARGLQYELALIYLQAERFDRAQALLQTLGAYQDAAELLADIRAGQSIPVQ